MYLKLGNTNIKYSTDINDFFIISEIIDSDISYEKPVFVRTSDELDIWFGDTFNEKGYLKELLKSGVTLYLYKPISTKVYSEYPDYINYDNYYEENTIYPNIESINFPKEEVIYKVCNINGSFLDLEYSTRYDKYIYIYGDLTNISELPQNINLDYSQSIYNRDSLRINYKGYLGPEYASPKYETEIYDEIIDYDTLKNNLPNLDKLKLEYETLSFDLSFVNFEAIESNYIILRDNNGIKNLIWFSNNGVGFPTNIATKYYEDSIEVNINNKTKEEVIKEFLKVIQSIGYIVITKDNYNFTIYSSFSIPCNYFFNIEGLVFSINERVTQNILTKYCNNYGRIEFFSKTIGKDKENIKIKIESLGSYKNRITVSKYNYSEVYEGYSIWASGEDRIDHLINTSSKLVRCNLIDSYIDEFTGDTVLYNENSTRSAELPTGEWELFGATKEIYTREMYWESLKVLMNEDISGYIDYFLIPDINKYIDCININEDYSYFKEYLDFLSLSKKFGFQTLIQNSDYTIKYKKVSDISEMTDINTVYILDEDFYFIYDKEYGAFLRTDNKYIVNKYRNDFIFNYTEDLDNRLIYFYRPLKLYGNDRPGYYLYLKSLLNDIYSATSSEIIYVQPEGNPYSDELTELKNDLVKKKSNYLDFNNQIYYYKSYQNGEIYNTTGWMRFCLGKITRELEKNKWEYLSKNIIGEILGNIKRTLEKIYSTFTIIRSIKINNYKFDFNNNILNLSISTEMSDLIENNVSLDITLNYNN